MSPEAVVVTWNSRDLVLRCVDCLERAGSGRVVVVDNASDDGTAAALEARGVEVVRLEHPQGLAAAYNRGAERTGGSLLLFLNDDVLVERDSLAALVDALETRPSAVGATGRLVDPDGGGTQTAYLPQPFPTFGSFASMLLGRPPAESELIETGTVAVERPAGACLLVRREAFEAVGGWDEEFEFWYEDVDLARRLGRLGELLYVPSAPLMHLGGYSAQRLSRAQVVSRHYRGGLLYAGKHFRTPSRVGVGLAYALAAAARILASRDTESRRVYRRVLRNGLRVAAGRRPLPP
jgi:GT2 family glycosyltransferase